MKQNTFALLLTLLLLPFTGARAGERVEYGRIWVPPGVQSGFVDVPEGVLFGVTGAAGEGTGSTSAFRVTFTIGEQILNEWTVFRRSSEEIHASAGWDRGSLNQVVGPFRVTVNKGRATGSVLFCYKLTYPDDAAASEVEVPADATGDVQVVMESSEDGQNWALAGPGPYPANGSKRKFRLRIVNPQ